MGAELIVATVWSTAEATFDWEAGKRTVGELPPDAVLEVLEAAPFLSGEDVEQADDQTVELCRAHLLAQVQRLEKAFDPEQFERYLDSRDSPDGKWTCWMAGGTSWGGSPNELVDAINALWWTTAVLDAIGFVTDTGERLPAVAG